MSFILGLVRFLNLVKNLLATRDCKSVLNYTFHIHLSFCLHTKNVVVWQIFSISNTFIDRFHLSFFVKVSLSATLFLNIEHKSQLVLIFGYVPLAQLQSFPSSTFTCRFFLVCSLFLIFEQLLPYTLFVIVK